MRVYPSPAYLTERVVSTTLKPSAHGWRLTFYDGAGEPLASVWATTQQNAREQARSLRV
jgi:hypothetical protein